MAKRGTGQMRTTTQDPSVARAVPPALLGRRRLPPAVNDNRPSFKRLLRLAIGPVAIVALAIAIWWG
jgi:hypothetical protein